MLTSPAVYAAFGRKVARAVSREDGWEAEFYRRRFRDAKALESVVDRPEADRLYREAYEAERKEKFEATKSCFSLP